MLTGAYLSPKFRLQNGTFPVGDPRDPRELVLVTESWVASLSFLVSFHFKIQKPILQLRTLTQLQCHTINFTVACNYCSTAEVAHLEIESERIFQRVKQYVRHCPHTVTPYSVTQNSSHKIIRSTRLLSVVYELANSQWSVLIEFSNQIGFQI